MLEGQSSALQQQVAFGAGYLRAGAQRSRRLSQRSTALPLDGTTDAGRRFDAPLCPSRTGALRDGQHGAASLAYNDGAPFEDLDRLATCR